jgi:hypothetical protein
LAENVLVEDTGIEPGDIVIAVPTDNPPGWNQKYNAFIAAKAHTPYAKEAIGIISEKPGFLMRGYGFSEEGRVDQNLVRPLSLSGRVPVKVSTVNGPIHVGDPITTSPISGTGMKATQAGFVVGRALENYSNTDPNATDRILVMISLTWYDPDVYLTNTGNFNIAKDTGGNYQLTDSSNNGSVIERVGAFGQIVAANIKAGAIIAKEGFIEGGFKVADTIIAGAVETENLATQSFIAFQGTVDNLLVKSGLVAGNIQTKLISPLADGTDVTVQIGTATESGKFAVQNSAGTEVASIDNSGNAAFAGNASVSGTLYADEIKSKSLDEIQALLAKVQTDQSLLVEAATWNINTATNSANLNELAVADLYITNQAAINSLSVTNTLTVGSDLVFQSTINNQQLTINSIDTLSAPLKLQSLAMAPVEIMAGLVTIDTHGNVNIAGNLFVAGKIHSSGLALTQSTQNQLSGTDATDSGKLLTLQDQAGTEVASVNASGSAQFGSVSTPQLVIAGSDATQSGTIVNGIITTNSTVGQAVVPAGVSEITIKNPKVTDYTLVYVTPTSTTENYVLYVKSKQAGQFVVGFTNPIDVDVNFNWWIVQVQN